LNTVITEPSCIKMPSPLLKQRASPPDQSISAEHPFFAAKMLRQFSPVGAAAAWGAL
jgi:hypothetical protein